MNTGVPKANSIGTYALYFIPKILLAKKSSIPLACGAQHYPSDCIINYTGHIPSVSGAVGARWLHFSVHSAAACASSIVLNLRMSWTFCPEVPMNLQGPGGRRHGMRSHQ
jgi:hypothetical protein